MKKKRLWSIILILQLLSLTGCWDSVELNDRAFIAAIGIDKVEHKKNVKVTLQIINPAAIGSSNDQGVTPGAKQVGISSVTGNTLYDALKNYKLEASSKPSTFMTRFIVIGEEAAKDGVLPYLDYFFRNEDSQVRTYLLITKGKASDIIKWKSEGKKIPAEYITGMLNTKDLFSTTTTETIHEFLVRVSEKSTSPSTSGIELKKGIHEQKVKISGIAAFKGDKFVGWLNLRETHGLQWLTNHYERGALEIGSDERMVRIKIIRSEAIINPKFINGKVVMNVDIKGQGVVREDTGETLDSPTAIHTLRKKANEEITKEITDCLNKVQKELKTDILGFGKEIHRKNPKEWRQIQNRWEEVFPYVEVRVHADIKIRYTGITIDPI